MALPFRFKGNLAHSLLPTVTLVLVSTGTAQASRWEYAEFLSLTEMLGSCDEPPALDNTTLLWKEASRVERYMQLNRLGTSASATIEEFTRKVFGIALSGIVFDDDPSNLNLLGEQGWELVSHQLTCRAITPTKGRFGIVRSQTTSWLWFKRALPETGTGR